MQAVRKAATGAEYNEAPSPKPIVATPANRQVPASCFPSKIFRGMRLLLSVMEEYLPNQALSNAD